MVGSILCLKQKMDECMQIKRSFLKISIRIYFA
jgi:hypothetical protein